MYIIYICVLSNVLVNVSKKYFNKSMVWIDILHTLYTILSIPTHYYAQSYIYTPYWSMLCSSTYRPSSHICVRANYKYMQPYFNENLTQSVNPTTESRKHT